MNSDPETATLQDVEDFDNSSMYPDSKVVLDVLPYHHMVDEKAIKTAHENVDTHKLPVYVRRAIMHNLPSYKPLIKITNPPNSIANNVQRKKIKPKVIIVLTVKAALIIAAMIAAITIIVAWSWLEL